MRGRELVALIAGAAAMSGAALAHPGPKILTAGGEKARVAMTSGVTYKDENSVHLFRGSASLLGGQPAPARENRIRIKINRSYYAASHHPAAHLRTQGFYSGNKATHRFTHGFFSDRVYP